MSFSKKELMDELDELKLLTDTAGAVVIHTFIQSINKINPSTFIGSGKTKEIIKYSKENDINLIIFNDDISPTQLKNLQNLSGENVKILDRSGLIIDIFSQHAKTKESKTQVELARLEYMLPRLTRQWTHLERQMGGIGTRGGPGEAQIEVDRRLINNQILNLKGILKKIDKQRKTQNKRRKSEFKVALAGYTNAGKSTLMSVLTGSDLYIKDQLFATLDTTTKKIKINDHIGMLISDTVGFIKKLPHNLIASFRSTLGVIKDADLILKVIDSSSHCIQLHINTIENTINELGAYDTKSFLVFNKIDLIEDSELFNQLKVKYPNSIFISANKQLKLDTLINKIESIKLDKYITKTIKILYSNTSILGEIYDTVEVIKQENEDDGILLTVKGDRVAVETLIGKAKTQKIF